MRKAPLAALVMAALLPACASLTLQNVDFGWPVEGVLTVSDANVVSEGRYGIAFPVAPLAQEEFQDSTALRGTTIRLLRARDGFYFVTGARFKNVYVFQPGAGELSLKRKIEVAPAGLKNPALNLRDAHVVLLDDEQTKALLTADGIVEGKQK